MREYFKDNATLRGRGCSAWTKDNMDKKCFLFRCLSTKKLKDEPPDTWDEEEQPSEGQEEKEDKEILRRKDKDLEFLFQEVSRNSSLDDWLKRDLHEKKSHPKYKEMLVSSSLLQGETGKDTTVFIKAAF